MLEPHSIIPRLTGVSSFLFSIQKFYEELLRVDSNSAIISIKQQIISNVPSSWWHHGLFLFYLRGREQVRHMLWMLMQGEGVEGRKREKELPDQASQSRCSSWALEAENGVKCQGEFVGLWSHSHRCGNYLKSRMKGANRHLLKGQIHFIVRDKRVTVAARNLGLSDIQILQQIL